MCPSTQFTLLNYIAVREACHSLACFHHAACHLIHNPEVHAEAEAMLVLTAIIQHLKQRDGERRFLGKALTHGRGREVAWVLGLRVGEKEAWQKAREGKAWQRSGRREAWQRAGGSEAWQRAGRERCGSYTAHQAVPSLFSHWPDPAPSDHAPHPSPSTPTH